MSEEVKQLENGLDIVDGILDADLQIPIIPRPSFIYDKKKNQAYDFYEKMRPRLRGWWDEFNTELDDFCRHKYKTVNQFARAKTKSPKERAWINQMIGRMPTGTKIEAPWLGDWILRRNNGYWAPEQPEKIKSLVASMKSKLAKWEAIRSSAPLLIQTFARYQKMHEEVDNAFNGVLFDPNELPTSDNNKGRFNTYKAMHDSISEKENLTITHWMRIHGVDPENPVQMYQVNQIVSQINTPGGIADIQTTSFTTGQVSKEERELFKLATMLKTHANNFNLPLPETLMPNDENDPGEVLPPLTKEEKDKVQ